MLPNTAVFFVYHGDFISSPSVNNFLWVIIALCVHLVEQNRNPFIHAPSRRLFHIKPAEYILAKNKRSVNKLTTQYFMVQYKFKGFNNHKNRQLDDRGDCMKRNKRQSLTEKYPPSEPCSCEICRSYCIRPGWWTVEQATRAIKAGYGNRMMLEISPDQTYGVLSPAFKGCEGLFALQKFARNGCNFWEDGLCMLHGTGYEPLECRYCHHLREGLGQKCHVDIESDWRTKAGQALVKIWIEQIMKAP